MGDSTYQYSNLRFLGWVWYFGDGSSATWWSGAQGRWVTVVLESNKKHKRLIIFIGNQNISHTILKGAEKYFQYALKIQYYYYLDLIELQNTPLVYFLCGQTPFQSCLLKICNIELLSKSTPLKLKVFWTEAELVEWLFSKLI